jgi:aromatic ring-opening dioxygenase catalytic subunit (LigB family)
MAEIVVALASSHSPQVTLPWSSWGLLRYKDETDKRLDYEGLKAKARAGLEPELEDAVWRERYDCAQKALRVLTRQLEEAKPDVIVILGDDQHEQFLDDNMPALSIYHGETLPVVHHVGKNPQPYKEREEKEWAPTEPEYLAHPELGRHLIESLVADEFDVARTNRLRPEIGVGHAFAFLYRRLWPGTKVPMVPFMVNTYFPPNQPTPKRCYTLGQALRRAIESWDNPARVALVASGGLSHVIMDEALDRQVLQALQGHDREALFAIPREKLKGGTSEILNWVAVAGAMQNRPMTLVDYLPGYRSVAGTGCGMGFAYWS